MSSSGELLVPADGGALCIETFGDDADPAIPLVHGAAASMLWWEDSSAGASQTAADTSSDSTTETPAAPSPTRPANPVARC